MWFEYKIGRRICIAHLERPLCNLEIQLRIQHSQIKQIKQIKQAHPDDCWKVHPDESTPLKTALQRQRSPSLALVTLDAARSMHSWSLEDNIHRITSVTIYPRASRMSLIWCPPAWFLLLSSSWLWLLPWPCGQSPQNGEDSQYALYLTRCMVCW